MGATINRKDLKITLENDGLGSYQSFKLRVDLKIPHLFNSEIEAYGCNEEEARGVLVSMIEDICHSISSLSRGREAIKNESK